MKNFKDKIVVITGAGSGMGREYAKEFAKRDSYLALNDFDEKGLQETVQILQERGYSKNITTAIFDVSSREAMHGFADKVKKQLGAAHIIINNAGIQGKGEPIWHIDQKAFDRIMDINFWGVVYGTQEFLPQILTQKEGEEAKKRLAEAQKEGERIKELEADTNARGPEIKKVSTMNKKEVL